MLISTLKSVLFYQKHLKREPVVRELHPLYIVFYLELYPFTLLLATACAAASLAIGTRNGEHET